MAYKWHKTNAEVRRLADGAVIPNVPGNQDWRDFQAWMALGNTPEAESPDPSVALTNGAELVKRTRAAKLAELERGLQQGAAQEEINQRIIELLKEEKQ